MYTTELIDQTEAPFDARALRMILAAEMVTRRRFAKVCGLDEAHLINIVNGRKAPGELARIRIARGLAKLGLSLDTTVGGPDAA